MKALLTLMMTTAVLFLQTSQLQAQAFKVKSFNVNVRGTSSLHDWESAVDKIECKGSYTAQGTVLTDLKDGVIRIPVKAIKSTKGKMMDNKTYDAFNAEKNPQITFTMASRKINATASTLEMKGTLAMAGTSKPVDISIRYKVFPNGDLQLTGSKQLKMTDFGIEPPTAMMGTVKVGNEVMVVFDLLLTNSNTSLSLNK